MELLIVRHADAGVRDAAKYPDDSLRPLSADGRREMMRIARGMSRLGLKFDELLDSGYLRARQTSECIAAVYGVSPSKIRTLEELAPEVEPSRLASALRRLRDVSNPMIVGHEPGLGRFVGFMTAAGDELRIDIKKGGVCRLDVERWSAGGATLLSALPPKVLRKLGK